jgi:IclR family KDG regulon transcriptional repressor
LRAGAAERAAVAQILTSVKRALEVLDFFSVEQDELSLADISKRMSLHKSSVHRILRTLEAANFLQWDSGTRRYRLSLKLLDLANRVLGRYDLRSTAGPFMEELAVRIGEIVHLSILDGAEIVYLEKKGTGQVLTVATRVGGRHPAYASAMGKVLLASLPPERIEATLQGRELAALTPRTITDKTALQRELEQIRVRGFALDDEEAFPGIRCVAAPIRDQSGRVVAAVSATIPVQRLGDQRVHELAQLVMETGARISSRVTDSTMES